MIEWRQKLKLKEIPRASNKTPKNPWTQNLTPPRTKNIFYFNSDILYRKTTSDSFEYPLKSILKSSQPKNYLLISGAHAKLSFSKESQNQKSQPPPPPKCLRSPPPLKIRSTPLPPTRTFNAFLPRCGRFCREGTGDEALQVWHGEGSARTCERQTRTQQTRVRQVRGHFGVTIDGRGKKKRLLFV